MRLFRHFLKREIQDLIRKGVRLHIVGNAALFPDFVQPQLKEALEATKEQDALHLSLVMNYGSRTEVLDAVQSLLQDPPTEPLTWETFAQRLYTCHLPDPDLIIRTSGEMRISNFLMLQAAYAELYFTPIPWPDFSPADFEKALESYRQRTRRYGKTNEQILASAV